ncbi:MAG: carbon storage regulator [Erysipelotrichales bacterium]|nr:carbon storage regulator [Erysipelotrichales bacterium]
MLVLARKIGESIVLDDKTVITIKEIGKDGVKIAIEAPKSVKILRKELIDSVTDVNKAAVVSINPNAMKSLMKNVPLKKEK